ncbi:pyruvate, water dikinase [Haloechinothrix sp. YIM 98757]|uniref:Pyruvate, water dikinase n=1 Tax=Haloechinothrix aidingensis TaxID=2752311 RepID=A0A838ABV1_9PSEU|nr:PEP/pyruvate-binding domain-containing protein [Haloechinothrix aidingensis]MBA0126729.1 pyruvate, water dikinase [Haloechinothrix aidingensis]
MSYIRWTSDCADAPVEDVGGKAAGLGALTGHHQNVPDGFVVVTDAYRRVIVETGLERKIAEILASGEAVAESGRLSAEIQALFEDVTMPGDIVASIVTAYEQLVQDGAASVAVRSSATSEDMAEASFAGQLETFLWVSGADEVMRHVRRCWASLFTQQAIAYRSRLDVMPEDLAIAVVVQRMVVPDAAGVMMTLEPVDGDRSVVYIEAAYGLGEGVVRGDVGVDRFWVDKGAREVRRHEIAQKTHAHQFDPQCGEARLQEVEAAKQNEPCLSADEVLALADLGVRIENDFEHLMDVEWAIGGAGRELFTLQARAETVWSRRAAELAPAAVAQAKADWSQVGEEWDVLHSTGAEDLHWSTDNIGEGLPGVLTPLGYSLWKESVDHAARKSAWSVGALSRKEVTRPPDDRLLVRPFFGRAAMQAEFYALLGDRMPGTTGEESVKGVLGRVPDDLIFHPTTRRYAFIAWRLPKTLLTASHAARRLAAETDEWWRASLRRVETLDRQEALALLFEAYERFRRNLVMQGVVVFGVVSPLYQAVVSLVEKTGVGDIATLSGVGGAEMAIIGDAWRASRGEITIEQVLAKHGFHGPAEGEVASKVWREDPEPLRRMVNEYAARDAADDPLRRTAEAQRRLPKVQEDLVASLPRLQRPIVRKLLKMAAAGIPMRGVTKRGMVQCIDINRAAARRVGELMVADGTLLEREDIFYLTFEELREPLPADVADLVTKRKARREMYRSVDVPAMWKGDPEPVSFDSIIDDHEKVSGIGVSVGVVEGRVRVVHDPSFAEVQPDEVLVAPTTDPSWSAIMFVSKALVVDIGGALSHAAVVARELGFPCVVNTRVGTKVLHTGDVVRVDGSRGVVEILERVAAESGRASLGW